MPNPNSTSVRDVAAHATRSPEEKLGRILDAGSRAFAERGYQATTIQEICRRARVSVGTFYSHFRDKHELIARLMEGDSAIRNFLLVEGNLADASTVTRLIARLLDDPVASGLWRAWREAVLNDSRLRPLDGRILRRMRERTAEAIRASREDLAAAVDEVDAFNAAWALVALGRVMVVDERQEIPPVEVLGRIMSGIARSVRR